MQLVPDSKFSNTFLGVVSFVAVGGVFTSSRDCAIAQIKPDGTLGAESSVVTPNSNGVDVISGGATRGVNLFHSFEQFSVLTGRTAFFNNAPEIQNIINRVTGGSISIIDGLLQAKGTANLFLLNPNGIIFGPNATLSIGGSFLASTANSLNFADGTQFSATPHPKTPLLTVSVPIGLQFGGNPRRIEVQGNGQGIRQTSDLIDTTAGLHVQPNQTLALVGGDVSLIGGTLKTAGGRIELGSVAGPGLISLTSTDTGWALGYDGISTFGDIQLSQQAEVDASGEGSGDIQVQGGRVTLTDGSQIEASTLGSEAGGTLAVTGSEFVKLIGTSADGQFTTGLGAQVYPGATGTGGNLTVKTGQLIVQDGAAVSAATFGSGSAGSLAIQARDLVELFGNSADNLNRSGLFTSAQPGASGAGGNLSIETRRLIIRDGAQIFSGTFGKGAAGSLTVSAQDSVELIGTGKLTSLSSAPTLLDSALATTVQPGATGTGGNLTLRTRRLIVRDGAVISTATFGKGRGGNLSVRAKNSVELSGTSAKGTPSALSARARGGNAGNLIIRTRQLTIRDRAQVTVRNDGTENAGFLKINANSINLNSQGSITASTASGGGGDVFLQADTLQLSHNSTITASAGGIGKGGNININTDTLAALENSNVSANAQGGTGGQVTINTQGLFLSPYSEITATSEAGPQFNGVVQINTLDIDPNRAILKPTAQPEPPIVASACQRGSNTATSEFVITGTGGIPLNPDELLYSQTGWYDSSVPAPESPQNLQSPKGLTATESTQLVEAQGWKQNPDGTITLTAEANTNVIPYSSLSTPSCYQPYKPRISPSSNAAELND